MKIVPQIKEIGKFGQSLSPPKKYLCNQTKFRFHLHNSKRASQKESIDLDNCDYSCFNQTVVGRSFNRKRPTEVNLRTSEEKVDEPRFSTLSHKIPHKSPKKQHVESSRSNISIESAKTFGAKPTPQSLFYGRGAFRPNQKSLNAIKIS